MAFTILFGLAGWLDRWAFYFFCLALRILLALPFSFTAERWAGK